MRFTVLRILLIALIGGAQLVSQPAMAQTSKPKPGQQAPDFTQMSLEQLLQIDVVSASKFPQKAAQAPSSVTVITAEEIRKFGYRTVAEILRSATGFYFTYDRNYAYLGMRGFGQAGDYNTHILLMINGHRINDPVYEGAYVDFTFPVDVDAIARVEIIRGPSSSLYGTNAFFGVVNVITRTGQDQNSAEISGEKSSYGTLKGGVSAGVRMTNGLDLAFSGSWYDSKGQSLYFPEFDNPATHSGIADGCDFETSRKFITQLSYRNFSLQGGFGSRKKGIPTGAFDTVFGDSRNRTLDELGFLSFSYGRDLSERSKLSANVYYDNYFYEGAYVIAAFSNDGDTGDSVQTELGRGQRWGAEVKVDRRFFSNHFLSLGAEFRDTFKMEQLTFLDQEIYLDDKRSAGNGGIYLQDEFKVHPKLTLNLGVRHEQYQSFGGTTNPRLAAIYSPQKKTTLKLLYGQAFRAPNAYELYYHDGTSQSANPDLKPEKITTAELILERQIAENLQVIASGYRHWVRGLISQRLDDASATLRYENLGDVAATGMDLEVSGKWGNGLMGHASYSFQNAENSRDAVDLANMPQHMVKLHFSAPMIRNKVFSGFEADYMSSRKTASGAVAGGRWLANLVFSSQKLPGGFNFSLGLYNLFDQRYGDPASEAHRQDFIWQDGRNIRLQISYTLGFVK